MKECHLKFFQSMPKHTVYNIQILVPNKYKKLDTEVLACIFAQHGLLKKCVVDNFKQCADRYVNSVVGYKTGDKDICELKDIELTEECEYLADCFNYFTSKNSDIDTNTITAYISYCFMSIPTLKCRKFFQDCIYVSSYDKVVSELLSCIGTARELMVSSVLQQYGRYLVDPLLYTEYSCFGREKEIEMIMNILSRKDKCNAVIVGNAGVGKSTLIKGVCKIIQSQQCPPSLKGFSVYEMNVNKIISGTTYRGDLEKRLESILNELRANPKTIVFIDELHTLFQSVSTSGEESNSTTIQSVLKPYLVGSSHVIGCTTNDEYRIIESDKAFERRFSKVEIKELSLEQTVETLKSVKHDYELFYNMSIDDESIKYIVSLCDTYIKNRYFPDKAIDILDMSCAKCRNSDRNCIEKSFIDSCVFDISGINPSGKTLTEIDEIEDSIKSEILGQDEAIRKSIDPFRRYYLGVNNKSRPVASLLFVGPTGVGKTELCKNLAKRFYTSDGFIRFDMSEFMESHSVSKLIGSPPGYIGYTSGGSLTEKVKHNPFSIILFDEIEKAHKDVVNILLQIMDDGRLTDSKGDTVDFCNSVIIMTSNLGCKEFIENQSIGFGNSNQNNFIDSAIKNFFAPEFLNRIDEIIYFNRISGETFNLVFEKELSRYIGLYSNYDITISDETKTKLKNECYDEKNGARFIRNSIRRSLERQILDKIMCNVDKIVI